MKLNQKFIFEFIVKNQKTLIFHFFLMIVLARIELVCLFDVKSTRTRKKEPNAHIHSCIYNREERERDNNTKKIEKEKDLFDRPLTVLPSML